MATPSGRRGSSGLLGPLCAGLVLGGLASALLFWLLSGLAEPLWTPLRSGLIGVLVLAAVADDTLRLGWRWPQNARQVPQRIRHREQTVAMVQFGFELGTGMRTFVTSAAPYVLIGVLMFAGLSIVEALTVGAGFGAGRALMPALRTWHPAPNDWDRRLEHVDRWLKPAATALTGAAAIWLTGVTLW